MAEKACEKCKWFRGDIEPTMCANRNAVYFRAQFSRTQETGCGPSGRYWEPKGEPDANRD